MERKLYLSNTNKKIGGVCGGLGEYLGVDPTIIRLILFLSIFLHGIGLIGYFIAWIVMPRHGCCRSNEW